MLKKYKYQFITYLLQKLQKNQIKKEQILIKIQKQ